MCLTNGEKGDIFMQTPTIAVKKLRENAVLPTYGSAYAAGADLYAAIEQEICIMPNETKLVPTGLAMEIPFGYGGFIYARSGLASKRGLAPANKVGVVDADLRWLIASTFSATISTATTSLCCASNVAIDIPT